VAEAHLVMLDLLWGFALRGRQATRDPRRLHSRWPLRHRPILVVCQVDRIEHRSVDVNVRAQRIEIRQGLPIDPLLIQTNHRVELNQIQIFVYIVFGRAHGLWARILNALGPVLFGFVLDSLH